MADRPRRRHAALAVSAPPYAVCGLLLTAQALALQLPGPALAV